MRTLAITALAGTLIFIILAAALGTPQLNAFDDAIGNALYGGPQAFITASKVLAWFGSAFGSLLLAALISAGIWRKTRQRWDAIGLPLAILSGWVLNALLKFTILRPRPSLEFLASAHGPSFPSGHAMSAWIMSFVLAIIATHYRPQQRSLWFSIAFCAAILGGLARLVLGVHHFSDIIAGFSVASVVVLAYCYATSRFTRLDCLP
ncbi:phosphatase PAP2 family protein [Iodobacter sp.]|uniref:phosphatase PAP2 family protein n=1 Tax=Iodobacter sp. TaxID=1915058 RepID=UPI0025D10257|nr:phosphatase PAP2 family protein [Iodobacter sp.]